MMDMMPWLVCAFSLGYFVSLAAFVFLERSSKPAHATVMWCKETIVALTGRIAKLEEAAWVKKLEKLDEERAAEKKDIVGEGGSL